MVCIDSSDGMVLLSQWQVLFHMHIAVIDMHPLAAASRSRLLETEPKLFVFATSYYAFCGRYCFEYVASKIK